MPRIRLIARCCGSLYARWQGPGIQSFAHERCVHCEAPLHYERKSKRELNRAKKARQAAKFKAVGLTNRGTPFVQRQWRELDGLSGIARTREREKRRYREKHPHLVPSAFELNWKQFRASLGVTTVPEITTTSWEARNA